MGFVDRKKSGNIFAGSRLVVDGQGIYNVKIIKPGFERKKSPLEYFRPIEIKGPVPAPFCDFNGILFITPTPTPTNTPTISLTPTITSTPTKTVTPTITLTSTPTETPTNTPTNTPTVTPSITATSTLTPTPTITPTITLTTTPTNTPSNTPTNTPSSLPPDINYFQDCCDSLNIYKVGGFVVTITLGQTYYIDTDGFSGCVTAVNGPSFTSQYNIISFGTYTDCLECEIDYPCPVIVPSQTPTSTVTPTPTLTPTITPTITLTTTPTNTPSNTPSNTPTNTPSVTPSITPTRTVTPTVTPSVTPSITPTKTATPTVTPTITLTNTPSNTPTKTATPTVTPTITLTNTPSNTPTITPTKTVTPTITLTNSPSNTPTITPTKTATPTITLTNTPSNTPTITVTPSITPTRTVTPTVTPTTPVNCALGTVTISETDLLASYDGLVYLQYQECGGHQNCPPSIGNPSYDTAGVYVDAICYRPDSTTCTPAVYIFDETGTPLLVIDSFITEGTACLPPTPTPTPTITPTNSTLCNVILYYSTSSNGVCSGVPMEVEVCMDDCDICGATVIYLGDGSGGCTLTTPPTGYYGNGTYRRRWDNALGTFGLCSMCTGCLLPGTLITMSDNTQKPIEEIQVGDQLSSVVVDGMPNDESQWSTWSSTTLDYSSSTVTVLNTRSFNSNSIYNINNGLLICSSSHEHVVKQEGIWYIKETTDINTGDYYMDINGNEVLIISIDISTDETLVYNIDVDNSNLYFADGILTHNKLVPPGPI